MAGEIREIEVNKLKPHPKNEMIYGQEDVSNLVSLIEARRKIINPIIINENFVIISGHRRWKAAQELGYKTVPCELIIYDNEEEELADLILYNTDRVKTPEQKAREGITLEETLSSKAFLRRLSGLKQNQTDMDDSSTTDTQGDSDDSDKGLTRDKVAKAVGLGSGRTFDRMKEVLRTADTLKSQGNTDDAELLITVLNRSASAANDLLKLDFESLSSEDREKIRVGKTAPRNFLPRDKSTKTSKENTIQFDKINIGIKSINRELRKLTKSISRIKVDDERERFTRSLIEDLQSTLASIKSELDVKTEETQK